MGGGGGGVGGLAEVQVVRVRSPEEEGIKYLSRSSVEYSPPGIDP